MFADSGKVKLKRIADGVSTLEEENINDWEAFQAVLDGIKAVPESVKDGLTRVYNTSGLVALYNPEEYSDTWDENIRGAKVVFSAIKTVHTHRGPIADAIAIIFAIYLNHLPKCAQEVINRKLGLKVLNYGSRYVAVKVISNALNKLSRIIMRQVLISAAFQKISQRIAGSSATALTKVLSPLTIVMTAAIFEDAGQARRRLKGKYPLIYNELRPHNLDMVYFLIEQPMEVFLQSIQRAKTQSGTFSRAAEQLFCNKKNTHSIAANLLYTPANRGLLELSKLIDRAR